MKAICQTHWVISHTFSALLLWPFVHQYMFQAHFMRSPHTLRQWWLGSINNSSRQSTDFRPMIVFTSRSAPSAEISSTLVFLFLGPSSHLLHRPENIVYSSNDPDSIVIVDLGMQVHLPLLTLFAHLFTTQKSSTPPTSNSPASPAISAMSPPKSLKHPRKPIHIWSTGMISSTRTHKRDTSSFLSHCAQLLSLPFSSAATPFSFQQHYRPCPAKRPKLSFTARTRT